jgi:hypothetical protein
MSSAIDIAALPAIYSGVVKRRDSMRGTAFQAQSPMLLFRFFSLPDQE